MILQALKDACLFCNPKKTKLFCTEINFLGHHISAHGIEVDTSKTNCIMNWLILKSATEVRGFLDLVRYISCFIPKLADNTSVLTELTYNKWNKNFPEWLPQHQVAFDAMKKLVMSRKCLTTINLSKLPDYKIFVTTDASDLCSGAVLSFGPSWGTACLVAFDSMTFKGAKLNYPIHKKKLLAIICALKCWCSDLIGVPFLIYMDHKMLENFQHQRDLSQHQACWMEFLSQYDGKIIYVKGHDNLVADALSHIPVSLVTKNLALADTEACTSPIFMTFMLLEEPLLYCIQMMRHPW